MVQQSIRIITMSKTVGIRNYQSSKQQHGKHQHDKVLQISKLQALIGTAKYQNETDEQNCRYKNNNDEQKQQATAITS